MHISNEEKVRIGAQVLCALITNQVMNDRFRNMDELSDHAWEVAKNYCATVEKDMKK